MFFYVVSKNEKILLPPSAKKKNEKNKQTNQSTNHKQSIPAQRSNHLWNSADTLAQLTWRALGLSLGPRSRDFIAVGRGTPTNSLGLVTLDLTEAAVEIASGNAHRFDVGEIVARGGNGGIFRFGLLSLYFAFRQFTCEKQAGGERVKTFYCLSNGVYRSPL